MDNPSRVSLITPAPLPSRIQVVRMLAQHVHTIEESAELIATDVAVPSGTPIDVLALDGEGGLMVIDVFDGRDSSWLVHLMHHLKWIEDNYETLKISIGGLPAAKPERVRGAGVVARMTAPSIHALGLLGSLPITCFKVRCFTTGAERFLALERQGNAAVSSAPIASARDIDHDHRRSASPAVALQPVELTEEEIADFLESTVPNEDDGATVTAMKPHGKQSAL